MKSLVDMHKLFCPSATGVKRSKRLLLSRYLLVFSRNWATAHVAGELSERRSTEQKLKIALIAKQRRRGIYAQSNVLN
jgi:hypothetical protein